MMTRNCLARIIPALWRSAALAALPAVLSAADLATAVSACRETPTAARCAPIAAYANTATGQDAALARFALGVLSYERREYSAAIDPLRKAQPALPALADYTAYYLGLARVEAGETAGIAQDLQPVRSTPLRSPLAGKSWIVEARAASNAVPLLIDHFSELPQPEGDLALGDAYRAAGDRPAAVRLYQRIYSQYLTGDASARAAAALTALKDEMAAAYPATPGELLLRRAGRLMESREYIKARAEYLALASKLTGLERDLARVRVGAVDYRNNRISAAGLYLRGLQLSGEAEAERQYYLAEIARSAKDDAAMMAAVARLASQFPQSPWRLRALVSAANRYLLVNQPDDYIPLYRAAYENFPSDAAAGLYHWKVTFQAYLRNAPDAVQLLREQLQRYPSHSTAGAALYFLARRTEQDGQPGAAQAYYRRLAQSLPNHYYAVLARERLEHPAVAYAAPPQDAAQFAASLKLAEARPVPPAGPSTSTLRIERSRLLRSAGFPDLADAELRFGARTDSNPSILAMELAEAAAAPHQAMRIMKSFSPDYLSLPLDQAPRRFWDLLFPLPFRPELELSARGQNIDSFLLAGLIRQESEFNPQAVSKAKAYGLTQVRPGTGRQYARAAGVLMSSPRQLFQPLTNLKLGSSILRDMLDRNGGNIVHTLASYNAGPARLAQWSTWSTFREPAEFIESIPFTETRDYVQAVLRNADIYRRLYR